MTTNPQFLIWDEAKRAYVGDIGQHVRDTALARRFPKAEAERICQPSHTFTPIGKRLVMHPAPECRPSGWPANPRS